MEVEVCEFESYIERIQDSAGTRFSRRSKNQVPANLLIIKSMTMLPSAVMIAMLAAMMMTVTNALLNRGICKFIQIAGLEFFNCFFNGY